VLVVAAMAGSAPAVAQPRTPQVRWEAPEGCPSAEAFRALLGDGERRGIARVVVRRGDDGVWIAWMVVDGTVREIAGASCDELARASALIVGLGLRLVSRPQASPPPPLPPPPLPPPPVAEPAAPAAPLIVERTVERPAPARWSVGTAIGAEVGALPGTTPLVRASVGWRGQRFAAAIDAGFSAGATTTAIGEAAVVTQVRLLVAGGRACAGRSWAWLCAGFEAGRMTAVAESPRARASGDGAWVAGRAGPALLVPLPGGWELLAEAEAEVPLLYPRFTVDRQLVHDPGGASFRSCLGVQRRFR